MVRPHVTRSTLRTFVLDALPLIHRDDRADDDPLTSARQVMARAFELWNRRSSPILYLLPHELLAECFSWFGDWHVPLAVVTMTSRRFRAVALSTPSLWADISSHDFRHGFKAIATMLERSMHAPLHIRFPHNAWSVLEEVEANALLTRNMYRAETLSIGNDQHLNLILHTSTPVLRKLCVYWLSGRLLVPQSDWAPQLQHLALHGPFEIPLACNPFSLLTQFFGYMEWRGVISDARRLFQLCPQLESMLLFEITRDSLPLLPCGLAPASLLSLELYSPLRNEDDCDLTTFVSMWHGRHMKAFHLNCPRSLLILLQHLRSLRLRPLSLDLRRRTARIVADNDVEYSIALAEEEGLGPNEWALIAPYLCDLTTFKTLDLPYVLLAAPSLPSLQEIIWDTTW